MIAVVNFTKGKKNVAIETILHWHISQHLVFIKRKKKKKEQNKEGKRNIPLTYF